MLEITANGQVSVTNSFKAKTHHTSLKRDTDRPVTAQERDS